MSSLRKLPGTGSPQSLPLNYWPNGEVKTVGADFLWRSWCFGSFKNLVIYVFVLIWCKFFNIQFKIQKNMVWGLFSISIRRWKYLILSQININIFILVWTSNKQTEKPIFSSRAKISVFSFFPPLVFFLHLHSVSDHITVLSGIEEHWEWFQLQYYTCFLFSSKY